MRLLFFVGFFVVACTSKSTVDSTHRWTPSVVVTHQTERTAKFTNLVGRGVIEFSWTDEKGNHREQGEMDFWKHDKSISLRVSKLGELIVWFGGEGEDIWFFDLTGDESTLTIGGDHGLFQDIELALVLLGLQQLPAGDLSVDGQQVTLTDRKNRRWTTIFDSTTHRPLQIEFVHGEHIATAIHRKPIQVEIENLHELYWPQTGGLIDISDNQGNAQVKIAFSSLSTIVEDEPFERVTNLEYLQRALKPTKIMKENSQ